MEFAIKRGTNISHWLSQSNKRGEEREAFFTEEDTTQIKKIGFDHIRLPVDEEHLWDKNGQPDAQAFNLLESRVEYCKQVGLRVIIDLHRIKSHKPILGSKARTLFTGERESAHFIKLWLDISHRFRKYSMGEVAYELMNEPVAENPEDWNRVAHKAYQAIRKLEPYRVILLGSNMWNSTKTFDTLRIPSGDVSGA